MAIFALSAVLLASFVTIEAHSTHPLLPLWILANRNRAGGYGVMLVFGGVMLAVLFFLTQFFQDVCGSSPIMTGIAFLPMPTVVAEPSGAAGASGREDSDVAVRRSETVILPASTVTGN